MAKPWYEWDRVDNFGSIDPQGQYFKPDSNIQIPPGYPVTALLSGVVTSLQVTSWGQNVVTIRLDSPLNNLATHTFYEHMSGFAPGLFVGKHVNQGDLIGYNNNGGVPLGFGLYSGDVFGSGSAWSILQSDLKPGGAGLLNPVALLDSFKNGQNGQGLTTSASGLVGGILQNIPGFSQLVAGSSMTVIIGAVVLIGALGLIIFFIVKETGS